VPWLRTSEKSLSVCGARRDATGYGRKFLTDAISPADFFSIGRDGENQSERVGVDTQSYNCTGSRVVQGPRRDVEGYFNIMHKITFNMYSA
jgi:hypothetical protein